MGVRLTPDSVFELGRILQGVTLRLSNASFIIVLLVLITTVSWAEDFTFRKTKWGMSSADVKASEPLKVVKDEKNLIGYKTKIIDKDVFIGRMSSF